jgi:ribosomal protein L16/L10AE
MRKSAIILTLLAVNMSLTFGQTNSNSISMEKVFGGYQFYQGGKRLTMNQLVNIMEPNSLAHQQIKSARNTNTLSTVISGVGSFMLGYTIGTALFGGEPNWTMAGIGAGLVIVSLPISQSSNKKAKQAVEKYNKGLQTSSFWDKNELNLSFTGNTFGLKLTF